MIQEHRTLFALLLLICVPATAQGRKSSVVGWAPWCGLGAGEAYAVLECGRSDFHVGRGVPCRTLESWGGAWPDTVLVTNETGVSLYLPDGSNQLLVSRPSTTAADDKLDWTAASALWPLTPMETPLVLEYVRAAASAHSGSLDPRACSELYWKAMREAMRSKSDAIAALAGRDLRSSRSPWGHRVSSLEAMIDIAIADDSVRKKNLIGAHVITTLLDGTRPEDVAQFARWMESDPWLARRLLPTYAEGRLPNDGPVLRVLERLALAGDPEDIATLAADALARIEAGDWQPAATVKRGD